MHTKEQEIVDVVGTVIEDPSHALARPQRQVALAIKQTLAVRLAGHPSYAQNWAQFQADPQAQKPVLVGILRVIMEDDQALAARLEALLAQYQRGQGATTTIKTEGAYVAGNVTVTNGDVVGRDQTKTIIQQGGDPAALAEAFTAFYQQIAEKPDLAPQEKTDVQAELEEVEAELQKGQAADEGFIRRRLRNVQRMAPDILDVVLTTFANPTLGLGMVANKIAGKMKAEAQPDDELEKGAAGG